MERKILIWVVMIITIALAGVAYVYWQNTMEADRQNAERSPSPVPTSPDKAQATDTPTGSTAAAAGVFADYDEQSVAADNNTKLLFFHAPWCPQCRMIESDINKQGVPDNVSIYKVDYDSNQALRQKYGVTLQTTFVKIADNGDKTDSYVAYNEPTFDSVKAALLKQ